MKWLWQVPAIARQNGLPTACKAIGICLAVAVAVTQAGGGGPLKVAGVTGFDSGMAGMPVSWSGGTIRYYTDHGDLSPILPQNRADAMVADAFTRWTSITTASIAANRGGQLNEDVSGMNVSGGLGSVNLPADIRPDATSLPVAIVYDADGKVTDALLGEGAGISELCSTNSVYGGPDNYTSDAHYSHALVIINGNCAKTATAISNVKYQLVRVLGRVFGLDWSDLNENVVTGSPPPTADDKAGFPLMHAMEPACWSPPCVPEADQPKMDDRAALSRLYPPGQMGTRRQSDWQTQSVGAGTACIHGIVSFSKSDGSAGQPMQGAKVVARWVDPATGIASHAHQVASVSGFLFRGNAGNPITGYYAPTGQRYDQSGSSDVALEGFYDLSGLEFPDSAATAQYEISVEPVDPMCAQTMAVGPYRDGQVMPSGSFEPVRVTLNQGDDITRDMLWRVVPLASRTLPLRLLILPNCPKEASGRVRSPDMEMQTTL